MGLSNAERQARWQAKRKAELEALRKADGKEPSPGLIEARRRVAELERQLAAKAKGEPSSQGHKQAPASTKPPDPWLTKPEREASLKQDNTALRQEVARLKAALAQEPDKKKIASLEQQLRDWKARVRAQEKHHEKQIQQRVPWMRKEERNDMAKCMHDRPATVEDRHRGMVALNSFWERQAKAQARGKPN